jgi:hypothetical protein
MSITGDPRLPGFLIDTNLEADVVVTMGARYRDFTPLQLDWAPAR